MGDGHARPAGAGERSRPKACACWLLNIPREVMERQAVDRATCASSTCTPGGRSHCPHPRPLSRTRARGRRCRCGSPTLLSPTPISSARKCAARSEVVRLHRLLGGGLRLPARHLHERVAGLPYPQEPQARSGIRRARVRETGKYQVLVKVVDIFGNDTSQMLTWNVK